jgi:hypothetical protein
LIGNLIAKQAKDTIISANIEIFSIGIDRKAAE